MESKRGGGCSRWVFDYKPRRQGKRSALLPGRGGVAGLVKHGVVSSNPARVTIKTPLVRKATGKDLMKSTSLEKTQSPVNGFC